MSAAMEASIEGIPSIGFSSLNYALEADFTTARSVVRTIVQKVLSQKQDEHLLLNVNIPSIDMELLAGIRICRQAQGKYEEDFIERQDPHQRKYYWLTGEFTNLDHGEDTDVWALEHNYASVVPVSIDFTDYKNKKRLETLWGNSF
jgi:5'-nucleotidase